MGDIRWFLLTRFNVVEPSFPQEARGRGLDPEWLAERVDLFARICVPSVREQLDHVTWLVLASPATPEPHRSRLIELVGGVRGAELVWEELGTAATAVRLVTERTPAGAAVVTTRLDNDDALSSDFFARLRVAVDDLEPGRMTALNFPVGLQLTLSDGRLHVDEQPSNPFLSLYEPPGPFKTVWLAQHGQMAGAAPVVQVSGSVAWMQAIHESNITNRLRFGRPVPLAAADRFAIDRSLLGDGPLVWVRLRSLCRRLAFRAKRIARSALSAD